MPVPVEYAKIPKKGHMAISIARQQAKATADPSGYQASIRQGQAFVPTPGRGSLWCNT
jgi:hypothetical protein